MTFSTEITAIWGGRGSGKTTLARKLIKENSPKRVIFIDPMSPTGNRVSEIPALLSKKNAAIVINSQDRDVCRDVVKLAYLASTKDRPVYIVCDEAPAYLDKTDYALNKIMFQGRHRAFGVMILSQRPAAVDAQIRSQAASAYFMKLHDHRDQQTAAQSIGSEKAKSLASFPAGQFIKHPQE